MEALLLGRGSLAALLGSDHWTQAGTEWLWGEPAQPGAPGPAAATQVHPPTQVHPHSGAPNSGVPHLGPHCSLPLQAGMPQTLSASDMVTPGSLSPPTTEPTDGEQAGQPLLDGAPSSASLETLIQHLVPTADYYPEVGDQPSGQESGLSSIRHGRQQGWEWPWARVRGQLGSMLLPVPSLACALFLVCPPESLHLHLPAELSPLHRAPGAPGPGLPPVHRAAAAGQAGAGQGEVEGRPGGLSVPALPCHALKASASRGGNDCPRFPDQVATGCFHLV